MSTHQRPRPASLAETMHLLRLARQHLELVRHERTAPLDLADAREGLLVALRDYVAVLESLTLPVPQPIIRELRLLADLPPGPHRRG
jgi:hypothetical protein